MFVGFHELLYIKVQEMMNFDYLSLLNVKSQKMSTNSWHSYYECGISIASNQSVKFGGIWSSYGNLSTAKVFRTEKDTLDECIKRS